MAKSQNSNPSQPRSVHFFPQIFNGVIIKRKMEPRNEAFQSSGLVIEAIQSLAKELGRAPTRSEFVARSGLSAHQVYSEFDSWNHAIERAGLEPTTKFERIDDGLLIEDWGRVVREFREIPTVMKYGRAGEYSVSVLKRRFGAWIGMPELFREFARDKPEWADVVALLPVPPASRLRALPLEGKTGESTNTNTSGVRHSKLEDRPTYGNPIDFRGLRHEPVNEQGVVFLFGMIANELGYMVEVVQTGYPDCEAKRQLAPNKWQRVRIEFEFESRNFRDHGHPHDGCDVIVCWRNNWPECPPHLEVVELLSVIKTLSKSQD